MVKKATNQSFELYSQEKMDPVFQTNCPGVGRDGAFCQIRFLVLTLELTFNPFVPAP